MLVFDVVIAMLALPMAALIRIQFDYLSINPHVLQYQALLVGAVMLLANLITGAHRGIVRHTFGTRCTVSPSSDVYTIRIAFHHVYYRIRVGVWPLDLYSTFDSNGALYVDYLPTARKSVYSESCLSTLYGQ